MRTTLLAAHALPPEFAGRADEYIDYVCRETDPRGRAGGAGRCRGRVLRDDRHSRARRRSACSTPRARMGCRSSCTPISCRTWTARALAAESRALSADHLEYTSDAGIAAMAAAGTVAVLLPGAFYALRETRLPPIAALREAGVPIAMATDCNPGTSPSTSLVLMLNMACTLFGLTPEEAIAGVTCNAARALGLADRGVIAPGMRADLARWAIAEPAELAYRIGGNASRGAVRRARRPGVSRGEGT